VFGEKRRQIVGFHRLEVRAFGGTYVVMLLGAGFFGEKKEEPGVQATRGGGRVWVRSAMK